MGPKIFESSICSEKFKNIICKNSIRDTTELLKVYYCKIFMLLNFSFFRKATKLWRNLPFGLKFTGTFLENLKCKIQIQMQLHILFLLYCYALEVNVHLS